ncbi:DUF1330 domain-containing protein [Hoyosella subflava]|uniref:DUF1330 domain-containing protein n=1 Tax=Hoyosella subflava (strain DSM 45089 / JCM 17490 / NBRC 109087 / DQS3-9A1) TaxID=443218 RepID=F6EET1_HOYSD|nr:DUF1330 domain-containing protein [Hoyosella subflava]AEF40881.1 hypothetical protein AS9A_2434 [Hoyosella subflava DQS3-9A1]
MPTMDSKRCSAYAIAYLRDVEVGREIVEYISRIDGTLEKYGGRFLVHGGALTAMEGEWPGDVIIIEFPSRDDALAWYNSSAYQEILPLRTEHSNGIAAIIEGVPCAYRATEKLTQL